MIHIFLPHDGSTWLCHAEGGQVNPLAPAPGEPGAKLRFSTDTTEFGFLDQSGKRLGHYRLLDHAPWFECLTPPSTLRKSCRADDFVIHNGQLIAGGSGPYGEFLWTRRPTDDRSWRAVALPEGIGKRGKSIDALFVRGNELIAIDNIMLPKWILVYPLEPELTDAGVSKFKLPIHTTYEKVHRAAEGRDFYAIFSSGINHGNVSIYIALFCKSSLTEVGLWVGRLRKTTEQLIREVAMDQYLSDIDAPELTTQELIDATLRLWARNSNRSAEDLGEVFKAVKDMAFCGDHLILALGPMGLRVANAVLQTGGRSKSPKAGGSAFLDLPLKVLASVDKLEGHSDDLAAGLYAVGLDRAGTLSYEWIGSEVLGP